MKKGLLVILLSYIVIAAPWKLMVLAGEMWTTPAGATRFTQANDRYWDAIDLADRLERIGWSVAYLPPERMVTMDGSSAFGLTSLRSHRIRVDASLGWNARYAVLAHEAGHAFQPDWLTDNQGDAFAEAVAALLTHDGLREHARFLARFKGDAMLVLLSESSAIYHAAAMLQ